MISGKFSGNLMKKKKQVRFNPNIPARDPDKLRSLRLATGLSQPAFADAIGISERTIRNVEGGDNIRWHSAEVIASAFRKPINELFPVPKGTTPAMRPVHRQPPFGRALNARELKCVREIAQSVGRDESRLVEDVSKNMNEKGRLLRLLKVRERERKIREERKDTQLLARYYRGSLAECGLDRYAIEVDGELIDTHIVTSSAIPAFRVNLEEELSLFRLVNPSFTTSRLNYRQLVRFMADSLLLGVRVKNEPVFCLDDIDMKSPKQPVSFCTANYLEYRLTLGKLRDELVHALVRSKFDAQKAYRDRGSILPRRKQFLKNAAAILAFRDRLCVGGVNVFFAVRRPNDYAFFVEERSDAVATARRETCIIPTGFHQPLTSIHAAEQISVRESAFRELWEELFNGRKVISHDGHTEADWYYQYPPLAWFKHKKADFLHEWIGFGLDLLDGSYQFNIFLVVNDVRYWKTYRRRIATNYEFRHRGTALVPISTKDHKGILALLRNPLLAHTSVFALAEGLLRLQALDAERRYVDVPDIKRFAQNG